ncbi:uncharacterized protein N7443_007023 [Penicillium atrosanguineum]|uniref:uncharacterized protein n=1 Tax=Penicillium atrosanguineum TaxID=1132637 RepID=UPI0023A13319|nr:uncharacterized protein N7443_007023 [Penicillium atrosanguineum]KAJ5298903.1 hypothetical protein N7443_007023 [Penicillium atrosanguineum]
MPPSMYSKDEKVLCFHQELLYDAKILEVRLKDPSDKKSPHEYLVHYKGWKNTYVLFFSFSNLDAPLHPVRSLARCLGAVVLLSHLTLILRTLFPLPQSSHISAPSQHHSHGESWDDWVLEDRLRKASDENRELASNLRRDVEQSARKQAKPTAKKRAMSDRSSVRDSEERGASVPGRGGKRARGENDIEKVSYQFSSAALFVSSMPA